MNTLYLKYVGLVSFMSFSGIIFTKLIVGSVDGRSGFAMALISACVAGRWYGEVVNKFEQEKIG